MRRDDPGRIWAERLLEPLRRAEVGIDVAPAVMARLAAGKGAPRILPGFAPAGWRQGLAWTVSFALALLVLGILAAAILGRASTGPEVAQSVEAMRLFGRVGTTLAGAVFGLAGAFAAAGAPLLRGAWVILNAAAPLVRSAGLVTAACGALSILVSLYIFAGARRDAPGTATKGGLR